MSNKDKQRIKRIKNIVIQRDGTNCSYCDKELTIENITMDHIVPQSRRGTFNSTNLTVSCSECNNLRGNTYFWDFIKNLNFSEKKILKYKKLYYNNLRIKVLNIAKEECLNSEYVVPQDIINQACLILKIKKINYDEFLTYLSISLHSFHKRNEIKFAFENLIKIIEEKS